MAHKTHILETFGWGSKSLSGWHAVYLQGFFFASSSVVSSIPRENREALSFARRCCKSHHLIFWVQINSQDTKKVKSMNAQLGRFTQTFVFPAIWLEFCMNRTTGHMLIFSQLTFTSAEHLNPGKKRSDSWKCQWLRLIRKAIKGEQNLAPTWTADVIWYHYICWTCASCWQLTESRSTLSQRFLRPNNKENGSSKCNEQQGHYYILHMQWNGPCFVFHQCWDHLPWVCARAHLFFFLMNSFSVSRLDGK